MGRVVITATWKAEAERRRRRRRLLDLTLMQVARRIGVSETTLHRYERGASKPRTKAIETAWSLALFREVK